MVLPVLLVIRSRVPSQHDRRERNNPRQNPHIGEHKEYRVLVHDDRVLEGLHNGVVAINADTAKVEDARSAEIHVKAVPNVTHEVPEVPLVRERHDRVEGHHTKRHKEIRERQTDDEVIRDDPKLAMFDDADDNEKVAQDGRDYDETHQHAFDNEREDVDVNGAVGGEEGGVGEVCGGVVDVVRVVETVVDGVVHCFSVRMFSRDVFTLKLNWFYTGKPHPCL